MNYLLLCVFFSVTASALDLVPMTYKNCHEHANHYVGIARTDEWQEADKFVQRVIAYQPTGADQVEYLRRPALGNMGVYEEHYLTCAKYIAEYYGVDILNVPEHRDEGYHNLPRYGDMYREIIRIWVADGVFGKKKPQDFVDIKDEMIEEMSDIALALQESGHGFEAIRRIVLWGEANQVSGFPHYSYYELLMRLGQSSHSGNQEIFQRVLTTTQNSLFCYLDDGIWFARDSILKLHVNNRPVADRRLWREVIDVASAENVTEDLDYGCWRQDMVNYFGPRIKEHLPAAAYRCVR